MVTVPIFYEEYIKKITGVLSKSEKIDYAFIFGSIFKKLLPESDIDILIGAYFLESFEKIDLAMELELILKRKVDIVLTNDAPPELILKALSKGIPVLIRNKQNLEKDYFRNFYLYEDGDALRKLRISRIKRRYKYGG